MRSGISEKLQRTLAPQTELKFEEASNEASTLRLYQAAGGGVHMIILVWRGGGISVAQRAEISGSGQGPAEVWRDWIEAVEGTVENSIPSSSIKMTGLDFGIPSSHPKLTSPSDFRHLAVALGHRIPREYTEGAPIELAARKSEIGVQNYADQAAEWEHGVVFLGEVSTGYYDRTGVLSAEDIVEEEVEMSYLLHL
ncbi:hypothetical protein F3Y22_tig00008386pilonHSYRG00030 [Hibiscus syriacus]|uniref:Uncharacterized protein n=1 Tax=Hibiscus syriacus TaxID=106335 RepID=A0A6A3CEJ9_HIBSY|nr:hypothetical protein F3Y22_tig00008386pilonHSYRG00030 [Hibiscus syriacus]